MPLSFVSFFQDLVTKPALFVTVLLILGVIFVNGWTDAPNTIAACVSTGVMKMGTAVRMAAIFNLLGILCMSVANTSVAYTIYHIADFGDNPHRALIALCAALTAIIVWAVCAWLFGIPTSESHALIAGLSGAAIAIHNGMEGIRFEEWRKVLYGLILSVLSGFLIGFIFGKITIILYNRIKKYPSSMAQSKKIVEKAQIAGSAAMAFMHGAQDGQKFMGVFMLGIFLVNGQGNVSNFQIPVWMMLLCSMIMALGTSVGGERIIKTVASKMVPLKKPQGAASDAAGAVSLLLLSIAGFPVSTTHVKTTAVMGVGMAENPPKVNHEIMAEMVFAWIMTFPGCSVIGYLMAKFFLALPFMNHFF